MTFGLNPVFMSDVRYPKFVNQVVDLAEHFLLCPVCALHYYLKHSNFHSLDQLFSMYLDSIYHGTKTQGAPLAHWVTGHHHGIGTSRKPSPTIICHSMRGVSSSWELLSGMPLQEIYAEATWGHHIQPGNSS